VLVPHPLASLPLAFSTGWPDHVRLPDIEPSFTCSACGKRGAEVRPAFAQARMSAD
jgi:hypothetical protein